MMLELLEERVGFFGACLPEPLEETPSGFYTPGWQKSSVFSD